MLPKNLVNPTRTLRKCIAIVFSLCAFGLIPPAVLSQSADEGSDPVAIYKQAGINTEQESAIRKLAKDYDQENSVKMDSLAQMLQQLRDMAYQKTLNQAGMLAKQEEINKLQSDMALTRIKLVIKIRGLLTPAQNEKLVTSLQSRIRSEDQAKLK
jgi:Spy/CpxP family protein refolding chaperone